MNIVFKELFPNGVYLIDENVHFHPPLAQEPAPLPEAAPTQPEVQPKSLVLEGNFGRKILVLFQSATPSLPEADLAVLTKMFSALTPAVSLAEMALLNLSQNPDFSWADVQNELAPQYVLVMGQEAAEFSATTQHTVYQHFKQKEVSYIRAAMPSEWSGNTVEIRRQFWEQLKQIFN
ncbi:hypothetical protein SAMN05421780_10184 [Flexibacter flexilis DSM 6793]|uniref:Uncharacterized protein n=1 Tax=Flexibacter flexilis DSM 6793 TaxID=927664 RepID=A0A1I1DAH3_9BACT|nr:hypothetical protein [Flexibacter flexilis]SFB71935.1 hypothetical protein SAMN05421780_10184 [Flexibacter flexilis DSM 6793]